MIVKQHLSEYTRLFPYTRAYKKGKIIKKFTLPTYTCFLSLIFLRQLFNSQRHEFQESHDILCSLTHPWLKYQEVGQRGKLGLLLQILPQKADY